MYQSKILFDEGDRRQLPIWGASVSVKG